MFFLVDGFKFVLTDQIGTFHHKPPVKSTPG